MEKSQVDKSIHCRIFNDAKYIDKGTFPSWNAALLQNKQI